MKYIKTYEQYSFTDSDIVNEEILTWLKNIGSKISTAVSKWRDEKTADAAANLLKAIDSKKDDKKMQETLVKLAEAYNQLPNQDKQVVKNIADSGVVPSTATEVSMENPTGKEAEALITGVHEEIDVKNIIGQILKWFGFSGAAFSFVSLLIIVIKIALMGTAWPILFGGITLGTAAAILMGSTFILGIIGAGGEAMTEKN